MAMCIATIFPLVFTACSPGISQSRDANALKPLIVALDSEKDDGKRLQLIKQLAALKSPKAVATLSVEMSNEKNADAVRLEALKGLVAIKNAESQDAIAIAALKSDSTMVRARAIEAIGQLRIREFVPACVRGLSSNDAVIRRSAVDALVQFNDFGLAARTLPFVKDDDERVRDSARIGAGLFGMKLSLFILRCD